MKMKLIFIPPLYFCCLIDHGGSGDVTESVFVMEGHSVTLYTGVETNQQDRIRWYFNDTRIAQITGELSKTCTDVQCNEGTERFRDRLKLDHQTGSLTIMNITTTDSGVYKVHMSHSNIKIFSVTVTAVPDSGLSTAVIIAGVGGAAVVLLVAAAAVIYCNCRRSAPPGNNGRNMQDNDPDRRGREASPPMQFRRHMDVAGEPAYCYVESLQTDRPSVFLAVDQIETVQMGVTEGAHSNQAETWCSL